jgi:all-trans-retinol 13,14-reductase
MGRGILVCVHGREMHLHDSACVACSPNMDNSQHFDDIVLGAGMAGLTAGALLARAGRRVLILEAHEYAGGYAHSFPMGDYRFCAQVHYIFGCGEGEPVHDFLTQLGLAGNVRFHRLDPEGFDHVLVAGERFRIPSGFPKFRDRLVKRFPEARAGLFKFFAVLMALREELTLLPDKPSLRELITAPFRFPTLLRYRTHTLQQLFDELRLPQLAQAVLAGQAGDYLLPPGQVSLLLHVALVAAYDRGAYYPEQHFGSFIDQIVAFIQAQPGCALQLGEEVRQIRVEGGRVLGVDTATGKRFSASRYISNIDPARTFSLIEPGQVPAAYLKRLHYEYSCSTFTMYLGLSGCDLREHGFGSFNLWRYPHADLNRIYRDQLEADDLSDPWLFIATPTLHSAAPGLAPAGHHVIEVATSCRYEFFERLRERDKRDYTKAKNTLRDRIYDILEAELLPGLRDKLDLHVAGTPLTNAHFCRSPRGNAYGAALTPANIAGGRLDSETPLRNLYLVNATAGYPSIGGTVGAGMRLAARLEGGRA